MLTEGILFTDHYQLTMAQLYHRYGLADRSAQFDYLFRSYPDYGSHQAGYCITAGLGPLLEWMGRTWFGREERAALRDIRSNNGDRLFREPFIDWLSRSEGFGSASMWAVPEGRVVHPNTPVLTVEAPLAVAQLLETPLLNRLNYATLIATKTSRVVEAAGGAAVMEFGMRRAPEAAATVATPLVPDRWRRRILQLCRLLPVGVPVEGDARPFHGPGVHGRLRKRTRRLPRLRRCLSR